MSIRASEFDVESWSSGLWPITALLGDEAFFITQISDAWRKFGRQHGFAGRVVFDQSDADASNQLLAEIDALSLFAERTLVELRLSQTVLEKKLRESIQSWISRKPNDKCLLVYGGKLGKTEISTDWFGHLSGLGYIIDASTIPSYQFSNWLEQEMVKASIKIEPDGKQAIIAHTQGNMLAAEQVLKRLKLFQPKLFEHTTIDLEQVVNVLTQSARHTVYDLVELALKSDVPNVNRVSDLLIADGVDAMNALWAIHRQIDVLLQIRYRVDSGESANKAMNALRIWHSQKKLISSTIDRLSLTQLRKLLALCHEADKIIKGKTGEPPWFILKDILFKLSGIDTRC